MAYDEVQSNSLESVGKDGSKKIKHSSVTYPQKRVLGRERMGPDPTTSPKRVTKKSGARKYITVKK